MKRIVLFLATNIAIMLVLGITVHLLGLNQFMAGGQLNLTMLLGFSAVLGFGGIAGAAAGIAKILFIIFLILAIIAFFRRAS